MKLKPYFTFVLLTLAGCFGSSYTVRPDVGVASSVQSAARAGAADWEANTAAKITFSDVPCDGHRTGGMVCIHPVNGLPPLPWEPGVLLGVTVLTDMWLDEPKLEGMPVEKAQWALAHELGHAMGLLHTGPGTLMYPYYEGAAHVVTPADVEQWKAMRK